MISPLALCVFTVVVSTSCAQFFNRGFFASVVDEPNYRQDNQNAYVSPEERIRELDEKLSARITQQVTLMRERIEQLEKQIREFRRSNTYDWIRSDSGSLYKIFTVPKNWDDAQSVCSSFGAHLAIIDTEHKNAFVKELFEKQFGDSESTTDAWIGLKTKAAMTTSDSSYSNFADSEKVDGCTVIDREGKWQVKPCALQHVFVCQQINVR
ncbi:hypothetical protein QR680_001196 [Steinernema hermaphroditum]|uniref:C-type lectin domain-containing protein n=1 Tax=Steinernema hermaphroditum TaxID=289476 RepID=A0AA39GXB4_9BILA|nr:hypothetical protein QR680_001196 [Steinernema hermaphroditum]